MSSTKAVATRRRVAAETSFRLNMHAKRAASNIASLNESIAYHASLTLFGELCVGPNGVARSTYNSLIDSGRKKVFAPRSEKKFAQHLRFGASFCLLPLLYLRTWAPGHLCFPSSAIRIQLCGRIHVWNVQDKCAIVSMKSGSVNRTEVLAHCRGPQQRERLILSTP